MTLEWPANPEPDVAGYRVRFGTQSGAYDQVLDVEPSAEPSADIYGLVEGVTYYAVVTALNSLQIEGEPSSELQFTFGETTTVEPGNLSLIDAEEGELTAPMAVFPGDGSANGWIDSTEFSQVATASYDFEVVNPDRFTIWCRVLAPTYSQDSWFLAMDGGAEAEFHVYGSPSPPPGIASPAWQWRQVLDHTTGEPRFFDLASGAHQLRFRTREQGTRLDRVVIAPASAGFVPDDSLPPSGDHAVVLSKPSGQSVREGSAIRLSFSVLATGTASYQWYRNGTAIAGANGSTLEIGQARGSDSGAYTLQVTSGGFQWTSEAVAVDVFGGEPLKIVAFERIDGDSVRIEASGQEGMILTVQASDDLKAWSNLESHFKPGAENLVLEVNDPEASGNPRRYYRLSSDNPDWGASSPASFSIAGLAIGADGERTFSLLGTTPATLYAYASDDLIHWTFVGSAAVDSGEFSVVDGAAAGAAKRFYRLYDPAP